VEILSVGLRRRLGALVVYTTFREDYGGKGIQTEPRNLLSPTRPRVAVVKGSGGEERGSFAIGGQINGAGLIGNERHRHYRIMANRSANDHYLYGTRLVLDLESLPREPGAIYGK